MIVVVTAILVGVLLPGKLPWYNSVRWSDPGPGLRFADIAQALSEGSIVSRTGELTLEIWLAPAIRSMSGNQEIISFFDEQYFRPLVIGQFPRGFILRGREDNPKGDPRKDKYINLDELGLAEFDAVQHLAVTVDPTGARLHVNGSVTSLSLPKTVARSGEDFGGRLLLGNSSTGWRLWLGSLYGVAVYERVLGPSELLAHALDPARAANVSLQDDPSMLALYRFEEGRGAITRSAVAHGPDLFFPPRMTRPTRSNFLSNNTSDLRDRRWMRSDIASNILLFMPLGFILAWKKQTRSIGIALAIGFGLSLSVESLQSLIPGRDSSLIDVASNSLGALAGALLSRAGGFSRSVSSFRERHQ
ncbi:MAG: VanZ family protein [Myxococcales bacterium]|nr:VanZ family protein [Myxococcales bacterium]